MYPHRTEIVTFLLPVREKLRFGDFEFYHGDLWTSKIFHVFLVKYESNCCHLLTKLLLRYGAHTTVNSEVLQINSCSKCMATSSYP